MKKFILNFKKKVNFNVFYLNTFVRERERVKFLSERFKQ